MYCKWPNDLSGHLLEYPVSDEEGRGIHKDWAGIFGGVWGQDQQYESQCRYSYTYDSHSDILSCLLNDNTCTLDLFLSVGLCLSGCGQGGGAEKENVCSGSLLAQQRSFIQAGVIIRMFTVPYSSMYMRMLK